MQAIIPEDMAHVEQSLMGPPNGLPLDYRIKRADGAVRSIRSR